MSSCRDKTRAQMISWWFVRDCITMVIIASETASVPIRIASLAFFQKLILKPDNINSKIARVDVTSQVKSFRYF